MFYLVSVGSGGEKMSEYDLDDFDTEWTIPFTDNYTGPFRSDGLWQTSVAYGKARPKSKLDSISRDHDTAYALCRGNVDCLSSADDRYFDRTRSMSLFPRAVGSLVKYGNSIARKVAGGRNNDPMFLAPIIASIAAGGFAVNASNVSKVDAGPKVQEVYNPKFTPQGGLVNDDEAPVGVSYAPQRDADPAASDTPKMYNPYSLNSTQEFLSLRDGGVDQEGLQSTPRGSWIAPVRFRLNPMRMRRKRKKNRIYVA